MGRAASAVRRWAVRLFELWPLSPLGLVLCAGAYAVLTRFARVELDLVWLVLGYALLALGVASPLSVLLGVLLVKVTAPTRVNAEALRLETGTSHDTGFALRRPWYVPLMQLKWRWAYPEGASVEHVTRGGRVRERVALDERGHFARIERHVTVSDAFGLSRVVLRLHETRELEVLPRLSGLRHMPALQAFASGDTRPHPLGLAEGDRLELRRYQGGDPARFIHWKVLARTRKLMVRAPERALSIAHRTAAFLLAGRGDDASAACARLALERGLLGQDWVFGTDREPGAIDRLAPALAALVRSQTAALDGGGALRVFCEQAERSGPTSLVVFAPATPGAWLDRVGEVARRRRVHVVIGVDGVRAPTRPSRWLRLLTLRAPASGTPSDELEQVLRTLAAAGAQVSVLDRGTGRPLSAAHRAGMRALDARDGRRSVA